MEILDNVLDGCTIQLAASIFRHLKNGGNKEKTIYRPKQQASKQHQSLKITSLGIHDNTHNKCTYTQPTNHTPKDKFQVNTLYVYSFIAIIKHYETPKTTFYSMMTYNQLSKKNWESKA